MVAGTLDLQAIKAAGVTFVASMLERVIEEQARGDASKAEAVRAAVVKVIGDNLSSIQPGSDEAARLKDVVDEDAQFYKIIQAVLVAHLHGNAAQISVEIGRGNVPSPAQPSFLELEEALGAIPQEA